MAQTTRAVLLAIATSTTLVGRRASKLSCHTERRSLRCLAAGRAAGRNAGGSLHSSPFFLSVWPRSWRTGRNTQHHWAPACRTGRTNRRPAARHIVPAPCHAVPRGTVRTPRRLQRVDVRHSACTRERPAVPDRAACPCHAQKRGTVPRLCRSMVCQPPWPNGAIADCQPSAENCRGGRHGDEKSDCQSPAAIAGCE